MVTFKEDRFIIEVPTYGDPIEVWLDLHDELLEILALADQNANYVPHRALRLLQAMLPDQDTANKMTNKY